MTDFAHVPYVRVHDLSTAKELLDALDPSQPHWDGAPRQWIFRGQREDRPLIPSALRPEARQPGGLLANLPHWGGVHDVRRDEFAITQEFLDAADIAGIEIPHDRPEFRDALRMRQLVLGDAPPLAALFGKLEGWPPDELLAVLALAQHYGVPTRLLDWTLKPRVAAYFACAGAAKGEFLRPVFPAPAVEFMTVWAVDIGAIVSEPGGQGRSRLALVRAPYASNPNLAAQAGVFTLDRDADGSRGFEETLPAAVATYIEDNDDLRRQFFGQPMFHKFLLPHSETRVLLRLLADHDVSAASVFPGHHGVVEGMRERRYAGAVR
jgi:hypothetical protein